MPGMSDGRMFTNYNSNCIMTSKLKGNMSSSKFRLAIQKDPSIVTKEEEKQIKDQQYSIQN